MQCFLVVVLVVLTVNADSSCENICTFLYNNPDWESHTSIADTKFTQSVTAGSVTGIITASLETFTPYPEKNFDNLRFIKSKTNERYQPIFFKITWSGNGEFFVGKLDNGDLTEKIFPSNRIRKSIQISDQDQDFYKMYIGQPGTADSWDYDYGGSSDWDAFQNIRLRDVQRIKSDGRCTVYKYISACTDPTPRLCDYEQHVSENVNLSSSFTLSCSGSGAPFLDVTWTKDGNPTDIEPKTVNTTTEPDHKIQSRITLNSITVDHLGIWTCKIFNKNFGNSVTKTYTLKYSFPANIVNSPDIDYYQGSESETNDTTFTWVVQSWPLERVTMECGDVLVSRDEDTSSVPPRVTFALVLRMQDVVTCVIKDEDKVLETRDITRVGYNCEAGEGGAGKECKVCVTGQTSEAGIGICFPANSSCTEGSWGVDEECSSCPENQTSFNGTVKLQECFPDVSYCAEGQYGYSSDCKPCPSGATSFSESKKIEECFPDVSYCEAGTYGYGTSCRLCPNGTTSSPESKKVTECYAPDKNLLIPIGGGAGGLIVVLVSITVSCLLIRQKKVRKSTLEMNSEINDVLSNDVGENATPANPSVSEHVEYATINRALPKYDVSCDETYAVLSRGDKSQEKTSKELLESKSDASRDSIVVPADLDDNDAYAKLGDVKRVCSFDQVDEESVYSKLDTPNSSKKTQNRFVKTGSDIDDGQFGIEVVEDPLYANAVPNGAHLKKKVQDPPKTGLAGSSKNEMNVDDVDAYAKLGDVKRVYSFDKDEDCVYSKLEKPGSSKKLKKSIKNESHRHNGNSGAHPGIEVVEDPLYANAVKR